MILARKTTSKNGKNVPQDWTEGLAVLLNETYESQCKKEKRYFDVYGQIFPQELLVTISYLSESDPAHAPITLFLSSDADQIADEKKVKDTQKNYTDLAGLFFDEIFGQEDWDEFEPVWQEVEHKKETYFFKITRENVGLTLEANRLLGDEFLEDEEFVEEDDKNYQ